MSKTTTRDRLYPAALYLRAHCVQPQKVSINEFTRQFTVSSNTVAEFIDAGLITRVGRALYVRTDKPVTLAVIDEILAKRQNGYIPKVPELYGKQASANDSATGTVTLAQYQELEKRVSALEQLLIRKGAA